MSLRHQVWQNTHLSLFDVTVVFFANQLVTHPAWRSLAVGLQLLFASVTRNRLEQAGHKLYFCVMLLITSWSDKKQRHRTTIPTLVVSTICFPVLLVTIVIAAVLASPLLPLFTLPIFLIGYPRPLRSWPGSVGKSACACGDTAFYKHAAMALSKALHSSFARGCLGELLLLIVYNTWPIMVYYISRLFSLCHCGFVCACLCADAWLPACMCITELDN